MAALDVVMSATQAPVGSGKTNCSPAIMEAIYGKKDEATKLKEYNESLGSWWNEYAHRKNDEDEEHVADSLLYDERCHLPRTSARPDVLQKPMQDGLEK